ncbi:MAG TPA: CocE/NonD family hydrolase C-terminal non-catalytic domain-containing protein [Acidimicrobiales bacterium]|nr:CocE/NonD family hydrolase C-terminal non-catalytic domain-containing protein [Acidimicrobiales bacterium]
MRPSEPDPTVATFLFDVPGDLVLMGGPVVRVDVTTTGPDVPLSARLWDVAPDGSAQGLVTRGTYRIAGAGPARVENQLAPQGYRFPAGHRVKLELTANDAPYFQASNVPAVATIGDVELVLPLLEAPATPAPSAPTGPPAATGSTPSLLVAPRPGGTPGARDGVAGAPA